MHKLFTTFVLLVCILASCEMNEFDKDIKENHSQSLRDNAGRKIRPVVLGKQKQNPFSLANMKIALDTIKNLAKQSDQQVIKPQSVDGLELEATDLYVRFLPSDSAQLLRLIKDTTLIVYDFPLDYEITQDGDYYQDPSVTNGFTWYYSVVKPGYQPPAGYQYEVIEELFIPENSEYFCDEPIELTGKSAKSEKNGIAKLDYNILKALYTVSFTLTGNQKELQTASEINEPAANDNENTTDRLGENRKSNALSLKNIEFTKTSTANYPSGNIRIQTPVGSIGVKGVAVRMKRWFTSTEVRTDDKGKYESDKAFNTILIGNSVGYYIHFDCRNSGNRWLLSKSILGELTLEIITHSLGNHSPSGYTTTIPSSDDIWSRCVLSNAVYDYCNIARADGVAMPPSFLDIANWKTERVDLLFPEMVTGIVEPHLMIYLKSGLSSYYNTVANTWHENTHKFIQPIGC